MRISDWSSDVCSSDRTHRNEDLVSGAPILKAMTGARVLHGPNPGGEVVYAETAREGDEFAIGQLKIRVLETPGHTDDHLAFVLHDTAYPDGPEIGRASCRERVCQYV